MKQKLLPSKYLPVFDTSSVQQIFGFQDILDDEKFLHWRRLEDMSWEDVFKTSFQQTKCLLGTPVSSKSKCVSNKFIFHKSMFDKSTGKPKCINPLHATGVFWYPRKISKNLWFFYVFRGYQKRPVAWNGLFRTQ